MDCYSGATYIDGNNQNNKTFRPEVGSTILINLDLTNNKVVWTDQQSGNTINQVVYHQLS